MALEFSGPATGLDDEAIEAAARKIGCQVAAVRAVIDVESRGGFLPDGRFKILFERHYFSPRLTKRQVRWHRALISRTPNGAATKAGRKAEYERAWPARSSSTATRLCSTGQLGRVPDHGRQSIGCAGSPMLRISVEAMVSGAPAQLDAFVSFIQKTGLADEMVRRDWAGFARGYNGPAYKANKYDEKLAAAFAFHSAGGSHADSPRPTLRQGDDGEEVKVLQRALGINDDGDFGPKTKAAVIAFQEEARALAPTASSARTPGAVARLRDEVQRPRSRAGSAAWPPV